MSFPTYINFQVNNIGEGRSIMVVHSHAVKLISRKFWDFLEWNLELKCFINITFLCSKDYVEY